MRSNNKIETVQLEVVPWSVVSLSVSRLGSCSSRVAVVFVLFRHGMNHAPQARDHAPGKADATIQATSASLFSRLETDHIRPTSHSRLRAAHLAPIVSALPVAAAGRLLPPMLPSQTSVQRERPPPRAPRPPRPSLARVRRLRAGSGRRAATEAAGRRATGACTPSSVPASYLGQGQGQGQG